MVNHHFNFTHHLGVGSIFLDFYPSIFSKSKFASLPNTFRETQFFFCRLLGIQTFLAQVVGFFHLKKTTSTPMFPILTDFLKWYQPKKPQGMLKNHETKDQQVWSSPGLKQKAATSLMTSLQQVVLVRTLSLSYCSDFRFVEYWT